MQKIKGNGGSGSLWKASAIGVMVSMCVCIALCVLFTVLVNREAIGEGDLDWPANIVWLLASAAGSIVAQKKCNNAKLISVAVCVLGEFIIMSMITLAAFDGDFSRFGQRLLFCCMGVIPALWMILKKPNKAKVKFKI